MSLYRKRLAYVEQLVLWGSAILPAMFVLLLMVVQWPEYWKWINVEMTPMTSLEVAVMLTIALVALTVGAQAWITDKSEYRDWRLLAVGFFYFALDDRFALHERIRDNILIPHDIRLPFMHWVGPGDFILLIYAAIGLALLPRFLRLFRGKIRALQRLLAGVFVSAVAVMMDSVELKLLAEDAQRLEQTVEECLELTAQILFLHAVIIAWFSQLERGEMQSHANLDAR
jgi:hypothetical protein